MAPADETAVSRNPDSCRATASIRRASTPVALAADRDPRGGIAPAGWIRLAGQRAGAVGVELRRPGIGRHATARVDLKHLPPRRAGAERQQSTQRQDGRGPAKVRLCLSV